jgi:hypothetical protein
MRLLTAVIAILFLPLLAGIVFDAFSPGGLVSTAEWLQFLVLAPGLACMFGLMIWTSWKSGPGANSVSITEEGLHFTWGRNRVKTVAWSDLPGRLILLDYTVNSELTSVLGNLWEVRSARFPASFLSREAFESILREAPSHGLSVNSIIPKRTDFRENFWGLAPCRINRFERTDGTG